MAQGDNSKGKNAHSLVRLKNDSEAPEKTVMTVMRLLRYIIHNYPVEFSEFVLSCRDQEHVLYVGMNQQVLIQPRLIIGVDDSGRARINDIVRNIVLLAVEETNEGLILVSPIA